MENTTIDNTNSGENCCRGKKKITCGGASGGCVYGLGFIGAAVYYIQHAATFVGGVIGFLKALVWPAMLAYKLLEFLK